MIQVNKSKLGKKQLAILITASALALLIIAYVIMTAVINAQDPTGDGGSSKEPPTVMGGEAVYNNRGVVYPYIETADIQSVAVRSHKDEFVISRSETEDGGYEDYFLMFYVDDDGQLNPYYPPILSEEPDTDYTDFYAIESSDGLNAYKMHYLCAAIGALYFDERIEPEENRAAQLNRYGLNAEDREAVYIKYVDSDGELREHRIYIGDKLITGTGYYFMLDGRDYIYTSAASERFSYLLGDFEEFLHSRVVAEGLDIDGLYEPYLTTDYKQWTNTYHSINNGGEGMLIKPGSEIVVNADIVEPIYEPDGSANTGGKGYRSDGYSRFVLDLNIMSKRPEFASFIKLLEATRVGDKEIVASVINNVNETQFGVKYTYYVNEIEAVISELGDIEEEGAAVGDNNLVKVKYDYLIDGAQVNNEICHAIIDLDADSVIPENVKEEIRRAKVGDSLSLRFDVTYTEENAVKRNIEYVITDINLISKFGEDGSVEYLDTITEDCVVTYSYKYLVDGLDIGKAGNNTVDLSAVTGDENIEIKNALLDKSLGTGMELVAYEDSVYCQAFYDFTMYRIETIQGFVNKEMVVSFEYTNASERDPFYGESIYSNTLENSNRYYALDASACQQVVYLLGGIGSSNTSQVSGGLSGTETVAIGLTPAIMDRYGLYDGYTVYFELPRGITVVDSSSSDELDDYKYYDTLGFYLYISKLQSDGTRYVGSNMYDIVVKIDGASFNYLEESFEDFWARKNLVMIDVNLIDKLTVELGMSDVYGSYEFDLQHDTIYIGSDGNHYDIAPESGGTKYNFITVNTRPLSENRSESVLSDILASEGRDSMTLENLYNRVAGKYFNVGHDTAGTAYFKEILSLLYGTNYAGSVSEAEREAAFDEAPKILSINFNLTNSPYTYTYDFYRISDRRVMVHLYRVDPLGNPVDSSTDEVSGFYISNFAAKKIVNSFTRLLNGEVIDLDDPYWE